MRKVFLAALLCACVISPAFAGDPRPFKKWCGWFMRQEFGVADRRFNRAIEWRHYGSPADGAAIGVIVVWRSHVGRIVGGSPGAWIVRSGNDGGRVRERERSVGAAIAFRWP
jgi:hypothetical protein